MSGYTVEGGELSRAAEAARAVAVQAAELAPGESLTACTSGMPGADAVAAIARIEQRWRQSLRGWTAEVAGHATDLDASAATYAATENRADTDFTYVADAL